MPLELDNHSLFTVSLGVGMTSSKRSLEQAQETDLTEVPVSNEDQPIFLRKVRRFLGGGPTPHPIDTGPPTDQLMSG